MHNREKATDSAADGARASGHRSSAAPSTHLDRLLGLQSIAGNAMVVQLLREADGSAAGEHHRHDGGCEHRQTASARTSEPQPRPAVQRSAVHDVLARPGRPLDGAVRTDMEARLGADFADVRIHDDAAARASAAQVGARAYTSGNHIVVGDRGNDRHTLAHELTHVIQQRQGSVAGTDNGDGLAVSDPSDRFEREAEANAVRVLTARPPMQRRTAFGPQRRPASARVLTASSGRSVQRAYDHADPANPQNVMTVEHLERAAGLTAPNGKAVAGSAKTKGALLQAGKKRAKMSKGARTMDQIVKTVGPALLRQLESKANTAGRLELYRAMSLEEAQSTLAYWGSPAQGEALKYVFNGGGSAADFRKSHKGMTIGAHLGDREQADAYHNMVGSAYEVMLRFTLKPGAHEIIFGSDYMALGPGYASELIRKSKGGEFQNANPNEGTLQGYIGVKAEENGPFSLAIAQGSKNTRDERDTSASQLLFQLCVEDVSLVGNKSGIPLAGESATAAT